MSVVRILLAAALALTPVTSWHGVHVRLSVTYPAAWHLSRRPVTNISDPVQRFVLYSGRRLPQEMGPPRTGQVVAVLMEEKPPLSQSDLRAFPRRPAHFHARLTALEGFRGRWGEITFRSHRRAFYLFVGVGKRG